MGPSGDTIPAAGSYLQIESSQRLNKNATKMGGQRVVLAYSFKTAT